MNSKRERDYVARHSEILKGLAEMTRESGGACLSVARLAARLRMDRRTVRAHLQIAEADNIGVFVDAQQKQFCTKEGVITLASKLGLRGMTDGDR